MIGPRFDAAAHARAMRAEGFWVDKTYDEFLQRDDRPRRPTSSPYSPIASDRVRATAFHLRRTRRSRLSRRSFVEAPGHRARRRRLGATAELVGIRGRRARGVSHRRRRQSADADFPRARIELHARFRRDQGCSSCRSFSVASTTRRWRIASVPRCRSCNMSSWSTARAPTASTRALLSGAERLAPPPIGEIGALPADEMAVLMFTSGTTGSPKGVMHCLNTLMACNIALAGRFGLDASDTMLVCSPLGHMTGYRRRHAARPEDRRDRHIPGRLGAEARRRHHGRRGRRPIPPAPPPFLSDMCEAVAAGAPKPAELRKFLCAGRADPARADRARLPRTRPARSVRSGA